MRTTVLQNIDQRFYASYYGRFNTVDPSPSSISPASPGSWNRFSYTSGDPVNRNDPRGMDDCPGEDSCICDIYGCVDPCQPIANSAFDPSIGLIPRANYSCGDPGPAPTPNPPPQPQCSISLYERPVYQAVTLPGGGTLNVQVGNHTYLYASDDFNDGSGNVTSFLCEGGPAGSVVNGTLQGGCASGLNAVVSKGTSGPTLPENVQVGSSYTGSDACDDLVKLLATVGAYQNTGVFAPYTYYPGKSGVGFNSNSYAYTLVNDLGLTSYFGTPGGLVPGWGLVVPRL